MKKSLFVLCTVALALVACHKHVNPVLPVDGTIRFATNIQPYTLKSTATSLDENDAVGIFATAPVSGENVKYTVNAEGKLTAADPLKWVPEDETPVTFMAYYPYSEEVTGAVVPFAVQADQTTGTAASDLMAATAKNVTPGTEVALAFTHQLSKVIVKVTNNLPDVSVATVTVDGVVLTVDLDLSSGKLTAGTAAASVKTAALGEGQFEAIIVPQTAKPSIVVKTTGADVYTFVLPASQAFAAGARYTAELTLEPQVTPEPQVAALSFSVADWGENTDLVFDDPVVGQKAWSVIGTVNGSAWDEDFPMTELAAAYTWTIDITYAGGDEFKFRYDGNWDVQYGSWEGSETIEGEEYKLNANADSNKNIKLPEAGEYTLTLVTGGENAGQLTVVRHGASLAPIEFADENLKSVLVRAFDKNKDGELSYAEAAAVTSGDDFMEAFKWEEERWYDSFDEFQYFIGLTEIPDGCFSSWVINSIVLPDTIVSIGADAFYSTSLSTISIPGTVTSIGDRAFGECFNLRSVWIPEGVVSLGKYVFTRCEALESIYISRSVSSIGQGITSECPSLKSVTVDPNNAHYDSRDNCNAIIETGSNTLIVGCAKTVIPDSVTAIGDDAFYSCIGLNIVRIPEGVVSIGNRAFAYTGLDSVTLPASLTSIGAGAFSGNIELNTQIRYVYCRAATPPAGGNDMFEYCFNDERRRGIYVPDESVDAYKSAPYWSEYANIIQAGNNRKVASVNMDGYDRGNATISYNISSGEYTIDGWCGTEGLAIVFSLGKNEKWILNLDVEKTTAYAGEQAGSYLLRSGTGESQTYRFVSDNSDSWLYYDDDFSGKVLESTGSAGCYLYDSEGNRVKYMVEW